MQAPIPDSAQHSGSASQNEATFTTMSGILVSIRVDLVRLGRRLELDPSRWEEAQDAFRLSARLADVSRLEALR